MKHSIWFIIHCTQVVHYLFSLFRSETFNLIIEFIVLKLYIIYSLSSEVKHSIWLYNSLYSSCTLFILSLQKWNIQFDYNSLYSSCTLFILSLQKWNIQFDYNSLYSSCTLFILSLQKWNIQFDYRIHCTQVVHYLFSLFRSETFNLII